MGNLDITLDTDKQYYPVFKKILEYLEGGM
ncbi:hypothetical protein LCGC14_1228070, partial [marine sediment metagenome]